MTKWLKWEMDTSRTVETWWNRDDGQSSINQATDHAVKVYNQDGGWDPQDLNSLGDVSPKKAGVGNDCVYRWGMMGMCQVTYEIPLCLRG